MYPSLPAKQVSIFIPLHEVPVSACPQDIFLYLSIRYSSLLLSIIVSNSACPVDIGLYLSTRYPSPYLSTKFPSLSVHKVSVEIRAVPDTLNKLPMRIMHGSRFILHRDCIHQHATHTLASNPSPAMAFSGRLVCG
jgi:hypothetical protein